MARILRETVAPSVADEHARTQLAQVVAVLRSLDAQDARAAVRATDAAVRPVLAACAAWVAHDDERGNHFDGLAAIDDGSSDETFAEANDRYESQRATLETFLSSLDDIASEVERLTHAGVAFRSGIITGAGGSQIVLDDPSANPVELFQPAAHPPTR